MDFIIRDLKTRGLCVALGLGLSASGFAHVSYSIGEEDASIIPEAVMAQENKKISLKCKGDNLANVLQKLEKLSGYYRFQFAWNDVSRYRTHTDIHNKTVIEAVGQLIDGIPLDYSVNHQYIQVFASRKNNLITGKVVDEQGLPLPGVSVRYKENNVLGAITDANGNFILSVQSATSSHVVFSHIGMESQEKTVAVSQSNVIHMAKSARSIDEVVVTGVYNRNKESFTGSSSTFKANELKKIGTQNIIQSLSTLDPSFKILQNRQYGSDPNRMPDTNIRGKSSVAGLKEEYGTDPNQPLFILDGFETTLENVMNLNMNRVASVTLLKDASSTAIYGSKASNGVVVIETKMPANGKLQLSYNGDFGLTFADLSDYNLMNSKEKLTFEKLAGIYTDKTNDPFNQIRLDNLYNSRLQEVERGVDTYWLSVPLRKGFTQKHNIYAEGGEGKIRYGIGLSYGNIQGVMKGSERKSMGGNIDLIYRSGNFQFSNKLNLNYVNTNDPTVSFSEYAQANPYYRKYNTSGGIDKYLYVPDENAGEAPVVNPLWNAHLNNYDKGKEFGFTNDFIIEWFISRDMRVRGKFSITKENDTQDTRLSPLHTDFDDASDTEKGLYTHALTQKTVYEGDVSATYGHLFAGKHMVNIVGGFNFNENQTEHNGYKANGFTDDEYSAPSFANRYPDSAKPTYTEAKTRSASFYVNGGYAYDNRYLLDFNYRLDGASMFGIRHRFRNTWSVGLGWNIHKESFLKDTGVFQMLKLRGSVGNPGNQNFSAYQAFSTYKFNGWLTNIFGTGVILDKLGNNNLAWQETKNYNVGLDITTWGNRISLTFDYYRKVTNPLLAIITTPGSMGVESIAMNAGEQLTNGFDGTLKVSPVYFPEKRINWTISLNMSHQKAHYSHIGNQFSALNKEGQTSIAGTTRYYDGGSPTAIWAVRSAGIDPATGKELFIKKDGTYSFEYSVDDEVICGDEEPKIEGVIGTTLYFKGFSLGCYLRYRLGGQLFNDALFQKVENINVDDISYNQDKRALYNRWSVYNREAEFKGISLVQKTDKSSRFVMDDNTLSGESLNIGYEFNPSVCKRLKLTALSVQANMNDFFYKSSVKAERGIDYPFARTVSFSLSATF